MGLRDTVTGRAEVYDRADIGHEKINCVLSTSDSSHCRLAWIVGHEGQADRRLMAPERVQSRLLYNLLGSRKILSLLVGWILSGLDLVILVLMEEMQRSVSRSMWYCLPAAAHGEGHFPDPTRTEDSFSMQGRGP